MPFALNEATRFISPTKTPEYLAAGKPVVCTPIRDVMRHDGDLQVKDRFRAPSLRRGGRHYDVTVWGAGFAGAVMACQLAEQSGLRVLVADRRSHIGGSAYDHRVLAGLLVHRYGPHSFLSNTQMVVDDLLQFTAWRPYEHGVLADVRGLRVPIPINRRTRNALYGAGLRDEAAAQAFLAALAEPVSDIQRSQDVVINAVGRDLYVTFFEGYIRKQWGLIPRSWTNP